MLAPFETARSTFRALKPPESHSLSQPPQFNNWGFVAHRSDRSFDVSGTEPTETHSLSQKRLVNTRRLLLTNFV